MSKDKKPKVGVKPDGGLFRISQEVQIDPELKARIEELLPPFPGKDHLVVCGGLQPAGVPNRIGVVYTPGSLAKIRHLEKPFSLEETAKASGLDLKKMFEEVDNTFMLHFTGSPLGDQEPMKLTLPKARTHQPDSGPLDYSKLQFDLEESVEWPVRRFMKNWHYAIRPPEHREISEDHRSAEEYADLLHYMETLPNTMGVEIGSLLFKLDMTTQFNVFGYFKREETGDEDVVRWKFYQKQWAGDDIHLLSLTHYGKDRKFRLVFYVPGRFIDIHLTSIISRFYKLRLPIMNNNGALFELGIINTQSTDKPMLLESYGVGADFNITRGDGRLGWTPPDEKE